MSLVQEMVYQELMLVGNLMTGDNIFFITDKLTEIMQNFSLVRECDVLLPSTQIA